MSAASESIKTSAEATLKGLSPWEMKNNLRKLSGRVFHVINDQSMFRYRVDDSGKILQEQVKQAHRGLRKVVTGDPEKKIRDYMTEVPQVKFIDKLSFTFGVISIVLTEFLALRHPTFFIQFYYLIMAFLMTNRYMQYKEERMELFLLDFCYFMNISVIIQIGLFPGNLIWFKANYVLCMGCLMMAILVWQNSLVFHSLDKLTSFFLHAFPPLTLHLYRWQLIPNNDIHPDDFLSVWDTWLWPLLLYCGWQLAYVFMIDVVFAPQLLADLNLTTSVRYLVRDKKNGMNRLVTKLCKRFGILNESEDFELDGARTKIVFMLSQFAFTLVSLFLTPVLYSNYYYSCAYIATIYTWCIWRGGAYYIEVFSERYKLKFLKNEEVNHGAKEKMEDAFKEKEDEVDMKRELDPEILAQICAALTQDSLKTKLDGEMSSSRVTRTSWCEDSPRNSSNKESSNSSSTSSSESSSSEEGEPAGTELILGSSECASPTKIKVHIETLAGDGSSSFQAETTKMATSYTTVTTHTTSRSSSVQKVIEAGDLSSTLDIDTIDSSSIGSAVNIPIKLPQQQQLKKDEAVIGSTSSRSISTSSGGSGSEEQSSSMSSYQEVDQTHVQLLLSGNTSSAESSATEA